MLWVIRIFQRIFSLPKNFLLGVKPSSFSGMTHSGLKEPRSGWDPTTEQGNSCVSKQVIFRLKNSSFIADQPTYVKLGLISDPSYDRKISLIDLLKIKTAHLHRDKFAVVPMLLLHILGRQSNEFSSHSVCNKFQECKQTRKLVCWTSTVITADLQLWNSDLILEFLGF